MNHRSFVFCCLFFVLAPFTHAQFATIDPGNGTQIEISQDVLEQLDFLVNGKLTITFPVRNDRITTLNFTALQTGGEVLVRFLSQDGSYNPPIRVSAAITRGKQEKRRMDEPLRDFRALIRPEVTLSGAAEYSFLFTEPPAQSTFVTIVLFNTEPEAAVLRFAVESE